MKIDRSKAIFDLLLIERQTKRSNNSSDDFLEIPECLESLLRELKSLGFKDGRYFYLGYFINIVKN